MIRTLSAFNSTRLIASGRLLLAEFLLFYAATDADALGFRLQWDDLIAAGYLAIAALVLGVVWKSWWADFILFPAVFAIDIVVFLVLPWSLNPEASSFSVAAVAIAAFILLCSAVRWNWRSTVIFAVLLNAASLIISLLLDYRILQPGGGGTAAQLLGEDLRRLLLLALVSLFMVWAGLRLTEPRHNRFVLRQSDSRASELGDALHAALVSSSAASGAIAWTQADAMSAAIILQDPDGAQTAHERPLPTVPTTPLEDRPILFDLDKRRAIELTPDDEFTPHRNAQLTGGLLEHLDIPTGISVPLNGATGSGRLVLRDIPLMSWDHLRHAQALASDVAYALDREAFELAARETALSRLRHSVARDLHDSVAQSLAGARFWLQAIHTRAANDPELAEQIGQVQAALDAENLHVRDLIGQLRQTEQAPGERSLTDDLIDLLGTLALHWRIETGLEGATDPLSVSAALSYELQQIVREAVANAVRHGQASQVTLELQRKSGQLSLSIADNGSGFTGSPGSQLPISISERITALGGRLTITSGASGARLEMDISLGDKS